MRYLLLLLIPVTVLAHDVILRVDGRIVHTLNTDRVEIIVTGDRVRINARTASAPPVEPPPVPPPDPTDCKRPPGVQVGAAINLKSPGGQERFTVTGTSAWPFRTTANPSYAGQFSTVAASFGIGQRRVWISKCAGGQSMGPRCEASGNGSAVVRWSQSKQRGYCDLEPNSAYWLNAQAVQCPNAGCTFYRNIYTNQQP